ncbi:MAG: TolA-binding protein [Mariniblastus sp.]|jgi:TolA-binding protein
MEFEHDSSPHEAERELDQRLEQLLKNVEIPVDFKTQLKQLPGSLATESPNAISSAISSATSVKPQSGRTLLGLVLAASLIGFGLFLAAYYSANPGNNDGGLAEKTKIAGQGGAVVAQVDPPTGDNESIETTPTVQQLLAELRQGQAKIDAAIEAAERAQLATQLPQNGDEQLSINFRFEQREIESIIAAMSEDYAIPLGMPAYKIKSRMAQVINTYPGTQGAEIARAYLERTKN